MADAIDRELVYEITVPALTTKAAPRVEPTNFNPGEVIEIELIIPPGVAGLAGIRIASNGVQLWPTNAGKWFVGDDEVIKRSVYNWPNSGRLEVEGYNEGVNAHTFTVRYGIRENPAIIPSAQAGTAPLTTSATGQLTGLSAPETPASGIGSPLSPEPSAGPAPIGSPVIPELPTAEPLPPTAPTPETPTLTPTPTPQEIPPVQESPAVGVELPPEPGVPTFTEESPTAEAPPGESEPAPRSGAPVTKGRKLAPKTGETTKTITEHETRPAGGWLPKGARYIHKRDDQGNDFITNWRGPIVAPGRGFVVHVLQDKPFPSGFGPSYAVVKIETGRFAGRDWYIGHCTAAVRNGQRFNEGATLAHADQGFREGGGWVELGAAPGGYPGPLGQAVKYDQLFAPITVTKTRTVKVKAPTRKAAKPKPKTTARKPSAKRAPTTGKRSPTKAPAKAKTGPARKAAPGRPAPKAPPPRKAAPPPVAARPPSPPPARAPAPPPPAPPPRKAAPPPPPPRRPAPKPPPKRK